MDKSKNASELQSVFERIAQERAQMVERAKLAAADFPEHERVLIFLAGLPSGRFTAEWVASQIDVNIFAVFVVLDEGGFLDLGEGWFCARGIEEEGV